MWILFKKVNAALWGSVLIVAGLIMLVTPGPGIAAILGGLAILAREYHWARRVLAPLRQWLEKKRGVSTKDRGDNK